MLRYVVAVDAASPTIALIAFRSDEPMLITIVVESVLLDVLAAVSMNCLVGLAAFWTVMLITLSDDARTVSSNTSVSVPVFMFKSKLDRLGLIVSATIAVVNSPLTALTPLPAMSFTLPLANVR